MKGVLPVYRDSFFCGVGRVDGLQLVMMYEPGMVYCNINISNRFEGYTDVLHGGMIFGILDVIVWYVIFMETKKIGMTRKTDMEFLRPVMCDTSYMAKGLFLKTRGKDIHAVAWVEDEQGEVYARVNALFREAKGLPVGHFINKFDFDHADPAIKGHFMSLLS